MFINPQLIVTASCFALSEVLPYLPGNSNNLFHLAVTGLNMAKLIPDDAYHKFESSDQLNTLSSTPDNDRITVIVSKNTNVKITIHIEHD